MPGPYRGKYFDGKTAASRVVQVSFGASGLIVDIDGTAGTEGWLYSELETPARLAGRAGTRVTSRQAPEAQIVIEDPAFRTELIEMLPRFKGRLVGWRRHRGEIVAVLLIVLVVGGAMLAIPHLSKPLAYAMPPAWDDQLGQMVERQLIAHREICEAEPGAAALQAMLATLPYRKRYDGPLSVRVIQSPMVNAFAAPGGRIMIMSGLIDKAKTPDEVAGVLAHELGHVIEHHPTANTIRALGLMTLLDLVMGDSSTVLESVGKGGGMLLLFAQSRSDEAAADAIALELLAAGGIDTAGFADFFARLEERKPFGLAVGGDDEKKSDQSGDEAEVEPKAETKPDAEAESDAETKADDGDGLLTYLSTHPMTAQRMRLARAAAGQGRRPALNADEWQALRKICGAPEETE